MHQRNTTYIGIFKTNTSYMNYPLEPPRSHKENVYTLPAPSARSSPLCQKSSQCRSGTIITFSLCYLIKEYKVFLVQMSRIKIVSAQFLPESRGGGGASGGGASVEPQVTPSHGTFRLMMSWLKAGEPRPTSWVVGRFRTADISYSGRCASQQRA